MGKKLVITASTVYLLVGCVMALSQETGDPFLNYQPKPGNWTQRAWRTLTLPLATAAGGGIAPEFSTRPSSPVNRWFNRIDQMLGT